MKATPTSLPSDSAPLLVFGAHPDDIEFGCGGIVALETRGGRPVHFVVCSRGEAASHGTAPGRTKEAKNAATLLGATLEFADFGGDAHFEERAAYSIQIAKIIRRVRPGILFAPSIAENQHPDHWRLGRMVRDAARLARFGGIKELRTLPPHAISLFFYYAITPESEPADISPLLIDISSPEILAVWQASMEAHGSQVRARNYIEMQLVRAHMHGLRAGIGHAQPLFPNDPPVVSALKHLKGSARRF